MKLLTAVPILLALASGANGQCLYPSKVDQPIPPDGSSASLEEMMAAQQEISTYVTSIEDYLACQQLRISRQLHNLLLDRAELAATEYNDALANFQQRDSLLANQ